LVFELADFRSTPKYSASKRLDTVGRYLKYVVNSNYALPCHRDVAGSVA